MDLSALYFTKCPKCQKLSLSTVSPSDLSNREEQQILEDIRLSMQNENIFIADGHHRYEVACTYRDQMRRRSLNLTGQESFNYIMAYFSNADSRGLTIFPIHRLIRLDSQFDLSYFLHALTDYFDIEEVKDRTRFFFLMEKGGLTEHVLGMYRDKRYWLLRLKNIKILDTEMQDKPREYRSLDVSILNHIVLKKLLKCDLEDKDTIIFNNDAEELIRQVDSEAQKTAFFLNPVKIEQIIAVALNGNKMPAKSTYFYPKVISGLVINKFKESKD